MSSQIASLGTRIVARSTLERLSAGVCESMLFQINSLSASIVALVTLERFFTVSQTHCCGVSQEQSHKITEERERVKY